MTNSFLNTVMDIVLGPVISERLEKLNRLAIVNVHGTGVDSPLRDIDNVGDVPFVYSAIDNESLDESGNYSDACNR
jgi:hypothetical protein